MREQERHQLSASIRGVVEDHRGRYGAPRIYRVLCKRDGYTGSLNRIQTPMRAMRLCAAAGKKYKVTTDSAHSLPIAPNLPGQDFSCDAGAEFTSHAKAPDRVRLSDITYLWIHEGWRYVCAVLDLFTRRIVSWAMVGVARRADHAAIDERHRQLLRQCADGELLALAESGGNPWAGRCQTGRPAALRIRLHQALVQHHAHALKLGLSITGSVRRPSGCSYDRNRQRRSSGNIVQRQPIRSDE